MRSDLPNGKSLTLNIGTKVEFSDEVGINIYANMPITSWLTVNGGYFQDRYLRSGYIGDWYYANDTHYDVVYVGAELHMPLGSYLGF